MGPPAVPSSLQLLLAVRYLPLEESGSSLSLAPESPAPPMRSKGHCRQRHNLPENVSEALCHLPGMSGSRGTTSQGSQQAGHP